MASDFDPSSLDRSMPQSGQDAILLLMRAWPLFEMALTDWLIAVVKMDEEIGRLFIGRMDTRGKISKLREIYQHLGDTQQVQWLKNLNKSAEGYTRVRNMIVHGVYLGYRPGPGTEEYELIYSTHRPIIGRRKTIHAVPVQLQDIKRTATFAGSAARKIGDAIRQHAASRRARPA